MPLYEYRCMDCDLRFELLKRSSAADEVECVRCGSARVQRLFSRFAARSSGGDGSASLGGGCSGCSASSCAACRRP
jgi:putative FmdB family regulatory protein